MPSPKDADQKNNNSEQRYFKSAYDLKNSAQTKSHYAKWAEIYDHEIAIENGYQQPQRCASALSTVLPVGKVKILDIGCGTGLSGLALNQSGYRHIDGCDLTPEMLAKAKHTKCYSRLFEADLNQPPIDVPDATYDAATCVGVFSFGHVEPDAIDEILRVLKSGGFLVIGLNDHFYNEGSFPAKLDVLAKQRKLELISRSHGKHMANLDSSTGWVITSRKL